MFLFFNSNCNEGGENQKKKKKDLNNWFHQTGWDYKGLYTVLGKTLTANSVWSLYGILFKVNLRDLTTTEVIVEMKRTLLFTQRRCSVFDGTHKVTLLAEKSCQVAAFCVSETNAECELMFSRVSQRPSGGWKRRGNFFIMQRK